MRSLQLISPFIAVLLSTGASSNGQQLNFDYYGRENGLVSNEVNCIVQNSDGYMFFGTPSGLSIFDGSSFSNYDIGKGFHHNNISDIKELGENEVLLFTNSNQYYRLHNQRLITDSFAEEDGMKCLFKTNQGQWIVSGYRGLYEWKQGSLQKLPVNIGKAYPHINMVMQWQDSLLVVGRSYESLDVYNMHTWRLIASSKEKLFVRNLFLDISGNVWIATIGSGILMMDKSSLKGNQIFFTPLPASFAAWSKTEFRAITQDKEGNMWLAGINNGLIKYNAGSGAFMHLTMEQGLLSNTLFSLYCDREDNIWIGGNRGVQKLVHKNVYSWSARQGLPADLVLDVLPLGNKEFVTCGFSGIGHIRNYETKMEVWHPPLADEYIFKFLSQENRHYGLSLKKLIELGISSRGIVAKNIYDLPEHTRSIVSFDGNKLIMGGDSSIYILDNGKISIIAKEGVHHISCMAIDNDGFLWTGTLNNSINCYKLIKKGSEVSAELFSSYPVHSSGPQDYVQCLVTGKKNVIYGTYRNGIFILEKINGRLIEKKPINSNMGLANNNITFLSWYNDSTLLAGTGGGLDKIILRTVEDTLIIRNINRYYNIINSVYSVASDKAGNILLATEAGVFSIPSLNIEGDISKRLPIVISGVRLLSNPDSFINIKEPLRLAYNNSSISISFSSPSFTNEKNTRYTWLLQGRNNNKWSPPSASGTVTYSNLPPGKYTFMVKPVNMYGSVGSTMASFTIEAVPAFWQTLWFYLILVILSIALGFLGLRRRIRSIRKESMFRSKIAETEMMALRAQMNPHFIFNCMNIIDGFITSNRNTEAQEFLQKFSKLIRLVLENSLHQVVPLQQDLSALQLYTELEATRLNHSFTYVFDVDEELLEEDFKMPPLLLQPYVENAIVHGLRNREQEGGQLLVSIKTTTSGILAVIEDNGIGRKKAALLNASNKKPHQHIGMHVTGKRIELLRQVNTGNLEIDIANVNTGEDTGTRVTIRLPRDLKFE